MDYEKYLKTINTINAMNQAVQNIPNQIDAMNRAIQSIPNQINAMNQAVQNIPNQIDAMNQAVQSIPNQIDAMNRTMRNFPSQIEAMNQVVQSLSLERISDYLNSFDIDEITETIDEYSNSNLDSTNTEEVTHTEELVAFIENEINQSQDSKVSIKGFIRKIAITFGITTVIAFISTVLIPYLLIYFDSILNNHQIIVDTFQETIDSLVSRFGDFLVSKATIRGAIEKQELLDYEHLSLIGIVRTDTFLREGSSKNAPIVIQEKIKVNTIVNLMEINRKLTKRKQNWIKVRVKFDGEYIEGWIEESKIQRFKKI